MAQPPTSGSAQPVEVVTCQTAAERRQFIEFQWQIYKGDPYWVPPIISERVAFYDKTKNPFFEHSEIQMFMAKRGGEIVGTIAAIQNNRHNETWNEKTAFFGGFETIDDEAVATQLFDTVTAWARERGFNRLRGPATLSIYDECGLLVDGFDDEPKPLMTYNPRYYQGLLERYGFYKAMDLLAWWGDTDKCKEAVKGKWARVVQLAEKRARFTVRPMNFKDIDNEVEKVKKVFRRAWEKNWGNVPLTDHELEHVYHQLKQFADPDLIQMAVDKNGELIGFALSLPNVNRPLHMAYPSPNTPEWWSTFKFLWHWKVRKQVNSMRFVLLGVLPEHRMGGVDAVMIIKTFETMIKKNYIGGECGWVLETNDAMNRIVAEGSLTVYKTYRLYDLDI